MGAPDAETERARSVSAISSAAATNVVEVIRAGHGRLRPRVRGPGTGIRPRRACTTD